MANRIADPAVYTTKTTLGGGELLHSNDANQDRLFTVDTLSTYAGNKAIPLGYIDGLVLTWVSGTALTATSGAAYIPSLTRALRAASDIAKTGLSLAASTWYHVYLYLNGATPDIEIVTTVPSSPYNGKARTKNADTSRRYLGSVLTDGSGNLLRFQRDANQTIYLQAINASIASGTSATFVTASLAAFLPITSINAIVAMTNTGTAAVRFRPKDAGWSSSVERMYGLTAGAYVVGPLPTNGSQQVEYQADSGGSANLTVLGYLNDR